MQKYKPAIVEYTKAIRIAPDMYEAYFARGVARAFSGDCDRAITDLYKSMELKPDWAPDAHWWCGRALMENRRNEEALAECNAALLIQPDFEDAHLLIGVILRNEHRDEEAFAEFTKAIELCPEDAWAYMSRSYVSLSGTDPGHFYDSRITDLTKVIELRPLWGVPYYYRAVALTNRADYRAAQSANSKDLAAEYTAAISDFSRAIDLDLALEGANAAWPSDIKTAYGGRGICWSRIGEHKKALEDFAKAMQLQPDDGWPYVERAREWDKHGDYDKAIADFSMAIERKNPAYSERAIALFHARNFAAAWEDVRRWQAMGGSMSPEFMEKLRRESGVSN